MGAGQMAPHAALPASSGKVLGPKLSTSACMRQLSCLPSTSCNRSCGFRQGDLCWGLRTPLFRRAQRLRLRAESDGAEGVPDRSTLQREDRSSTRDKAVQERIALLELYTSSDDEGDASAASVRPNSSYLPEDGSASAAPRPPQTVAEKLMEQCKVVTNEEVTIPIGPPRKLIRRNVKPVTEAQRRNLKRAQYLEQSSQRNDSSFFAVVASAVLLPPVVILAVAYSSGYLEFLQ